MSTPPYQLIPPMPMMPELSPVPEDCIGMGLTAENLQVMYNIPREESDKFALRSQVLARKAIDAGYFAEEIIPVTVPQGKKKPPIEFTADEHPRATSLEALSALPPAFKKDGTVTAGNSSGRNDGSAFVLMMTREKADALGYKPMAKWLSGGDYGVDPKIMGIGPAYAIPIALKRAGLKIADVDVMECNEAFAVQNLAVIRELEKQTGEKIDLEGKWNPNGGAIAFGHPNGASGSADLHVHHARADPPGRQVRILQLLLRRRTGRRHRHREPAAVMNDPVPLSCRRKPVQKPSRPHA